MVSTTEAALALFATLCLLDSCWASRVQGFGQASEARVLDRSGRKLLAPICYGDFTDTCIGGSPDCCAQYDAFPFSNRCLKRVRPEVTCDAGFSEQNVCIEQTFQVPNKRRLLDGWTCSDNGNIYVQGGSVANDPVMTGFDAKTFLFEQLGEFPLVHEGDGWKVNATFSPVPVIKSEVEPKERSFTSAVTVTAPNGDVVSCSLPALTPNTTRVHMTAQRANDGKPVDITPAQPSLEMEQMKANGGVTWKTTPSGEWYSYVVSCDIETPKMKVKVYQVSGWEEAQAKPEEHGWAAPYTWLNMDFQITEILTAPVTGVLGDTYPQTRIAAGVDGLDTTGEEGPVARSLLKHSDATPLLASVNGLGDQ